MTITTEREQAHPPTPQAVLQQLRVVLRAAQRYSAQMEKQAGLPGAQMWALQEIVDTPGLRVGDLAVRMSLHPSTTSNLVERLETGGFITKLRNATDQRVVKLQPTDAGLQLVSRSPMPRRGLLPEVLGAMPQADLMQVYAGLQALVNRLDVDGGLLS
ncbi:MAG: MarR family winged helix-turn-helix transcriptional regulator [Moraxellaceae bacterium]|nr:MarR family winged helix-turn-helix transcriptional regulator [Moraxellaceae bacterium]